MTKGHIMKLEAYRGYSIVTVGEDEHNIHYGADVVDTATTLEGAKRIIDGWVEGDVR